MCGKGGGSPPVPSGSSTAFQSTVTPNPVATPMYTDFLNRASSLSNTPFNPGMFGQVAPLTSNQVQAGESMFNQGMNMGNFEPAKIQEIMSPYIGNVVGATQNWFNNQNAIQANDLMSQAIRSGNAFGGDRAGVAEGVLAGQQQLAQAPVIAGLYQSGYGQALDEYNRLKQFGLQGTQAALGWGSMQQAQQQREFDVAQQNAMMQSAYPFQTLNWYGAILGGIAPLLGSQAVGYNTPPNPGGAGFKRGGMVLERRRQAGLVPVFVRANNGGIIAGLAYGGSTDDDEDKEEKRPRDSESPDTGGEPELPERERAKSWGSEIGQLQTSGRGAPTAPSFAGGTPQQPQSTLSRIGEGVGTLGKIIDVGAKVAPFLAVMSDPKTKTDVQRVGKTDDGDSLYAFRYKGDPKSYPKVVGPMARPMGGTIPGIRRYADAGDVDEPLTMRDLGVLSDSGEELPRSISGPARGSPAGEPLTQAEDQPNLARVRERFRPALEGSPALARKFDATTTAEVGTRPEARAAYQALTMDRAAARGEPLGQTITDPNYYPASTLAARSTSGQGVSPSLWQGANPANFATGNASFDPKTGRWVGFAGGPQTGSVATGSGTETVGIEGPDLAAARRYGYMGPSKTAIGARGPQGTGDETTPGEQGAPSRAAGPATAGMGPVGGRIPGAPGSGGILGGITDIAKEGLRNPLVQLVGGYLSGTSPWGRVNLGRALLATTETQAKQREADRRELLDQKPELIHTEKGMAYKYPDGTITHLAMKGADQAIRERRASIEEATPITTKQSTVGDYGETRTEERNWVPQVDPNTGKVTWVPFQGQGAPAAAPQQQAPAPGQQQAPPTGVGNALIRQTEAAPAPGGGGGAAAPAPGGGTGAAAPSPQIATAGPLTPPPDVQQVDPQIWNNTRQAWETGAVKPGGALTSGSRNEAALEGRNPRVQREVKALVNYELDPNKHWPGVKNAETKRAALDLARQYDPSYDPASFANKQATRRAYEAVGVEARNFQSNDMAMQHLGRAMDNVEGLNNIGGRFGANWVNDLRSKAKTQLPGFVDQEYKARLDAMRTDLTAVSTELAKSFRGAGALAQRELQDWEAKLSATSSPESMRAVLKEGAVLLHGRLNANASRYNEAMGPQYARPAESWLSAKGQEALRRAYAIDPQKPIPPAGGAQAQGPAEPQPQQQPIRRQAPTQVQSIDEARKLAPGTKFIIPDGSGRIGTVPQPRQ